MEAAKKTNKLLLPIFMLSGGAILGILNLVSNVFTISDFTKGFLEGIAITFSCMGLFYLIFTLIKYKK